MGQAPQRAADGTFRLTADLLERHDRPGPRYTSYPTAVEFGEDVDAGVYDRVLADAGKRRDDPLSVYVHLPFCDERCFFCGCNVIVSPHKERALPYLDLLRREVDLVASRLPRRRGLAQLHLGGGTPTYFDPARLGAFLDELLERFPPLPGAELAIEADPRVTSEAHLDALAARGFNRISFGVQDFSETVQRAIHRVQSVEQTRRLIEAARALGFRGINVDLIYGLPHQDVPSFRRTIETVIELGADRAAVYSFAWVPWMHAHMNKMPADALPDRRTKLELFVAAREGFLGAGYVPIGMDHFARPDDELALARRAGRLGRNFQGYTVVPADDVIGFGISAIGDLGGTYVQNHKKLSLYSAALAAGRLPVERGVRLSVDDRIRRAVIRQLMCNFSVDFATIEQRFGIDFADYFAADLARLDAAAVDGLVEIAPTRIRATPLGQVFVRNLAMCFDRYLEQHDGDAGGPMFSRTV